jgi:RNA ligase
VKFQNGFLDNQNILITFVVMEISLEILNQYHEQGLLYKQVHTNLPLTIWNYSEKVQYEGLWDDITSMCRGLVTDDKGIVARPFRKFFNMEEGKHTPTSNFDVYEKMDGSLGILFYYGQEWVFASRGSFTSEQALKFKEIFTKKYETSYLYHTSTYLFEIIYPTNRIVVDYGEMEDVIMLGEINTEHGQELDLDHYKNSIFNVVKKYDGISDYSTLKGMVENNAEGFVVRFSNGERMKIKGDEYIRLHKIMTNLSTTAVWEVLSVGGSMDELLKDVPDEFYNKIKEYENELKSRFQLIDTDYYDLFKYIQIKVQEYGGNRGTFARLAKEYTYPSLLFGLLDGKSISSTIWKIVKPEFKKL